MGPTVVVMLGLVLLARGWSPQSSVVLLPDSDGRVGEIQVGSQSGQQQLATAYTRASVGATGAISLRTEQPQDMARVYAATLDARPAAPVSFTLYFEFGSAVDIAPAFRPVLDQILAAMGSFSAPEITVIGHTDRVGSIESNDALSIQRAETVRELLVNAGIPANLIQVAGRGEREPVVPTADEEPNDKNRRVEINLR